LAQRSLYSTMHRPAAGCLQASRQGQRGPRLRVGCKQLLGPTQSSSLTSSPSRSPAVSQVASAYPRPRHLTRKMRRPLRQRCAMMRSTCGQGERRAGGSQSAGSSAGLTEDKANGVCWATLTQQTGWQGAPLHPQMHAVVRPHLAPVWVHAFLQVWIQLPRRLLLLEVAEKRQAVHCKSRTKQAAAACICTMRQAAQSRGGA
jgi:hypothetical protein